MKKHHWLINARFRILSFLCYQSIIIIDFFPQIEWLCLCVFMVVCVWERDISLISYKNGNKSFKWFSYTLRFPPLTYLCLSPSRHLETICTLRVHVCVCVYHNADAVVFSEGRWGWWGGCWVTERWRERERSILSGSTMSQAGYFGYIWREWWKTVKWLW